jgi:hypothetical protein
VESTALRKLTESALTNSWAPALAIKPKTMDNIEIDKPRDIIIVERANGNTIPVGANLFCGCCGETLGTMDEEITFPFDSPDLVKRLKDRSFVTSRMGLTHETCRHTMFSFRDKWAFILVENYFKGIDKTEP